jgi:hypothetical protein
VASNTQQPSFVPCRHLIIDAADESLLKYTPLRRSLLISRVVDPAFNLAMNVFMNDVKPSSRERFGIMNDDV